MKTLLIITSIILLSLQINRFFLHDSDGGFIKSELKILDDNFVNTTYFPEIDSTFRSAKSLKKENIAVAAVAVEKIAVANTAQHTVAAQRTATANRYFTSTLNNNCRMLHRFVKETHNYISFTTVNFDFNKSEALDTKQFNEILQLADKLIFDSTLKISIAGFADGKGNINHNEELSLLRANDVKDYMIELGVKEEQVLLSANGIDDPVAENTSEQGRAMNRRVELALLQ